LNTEGTPNMAFAGIEATDTLQQYPLSAEEVLTDALANLATFKAKALRLDAAKNGVKVARAGYIPQVSIFGELNTNYSSAAEFLNETGTSVEETGDFVSVNGQEYPVL